MFARLLWLLVLTALGVAHAHTDHKAITTSSNSEHGVSKQQKPAIATQRWHAGSPRVLAARDGTKVQSTGASVLEEKRTFRSDSGVARPGTKAVIADHHSKSASIKLESFYERRYEKTKMARFLSYKNGESTIAQADLETTGVGHFRPPSKRAVNHPKDRGLNHRHKRSTTDLQNGTSPREGQINHTVSPSTPQPRTAGDMWELLPRPLAQNQSTAFPFDYTRNYDMFTFPDADYEEITPLVPINTREKTAVVKNPFYPVTGETYGAYTIMCLSVIIFTVGIIGNIAIMCIVCHNYYMRSISNSLLANLALWDFVVLFFCLPLVVFHELTKNWLLGEFSCKIIPYIEVVSLGVTTFTLCALCIDRFRAATNVQMYYEMIENCASTSAKLAVIWVGALLLALPELLLRQLVREEREPPEVTPCERCVIRISTSLPDTLYVLGLTYDGARLWWYFGCYFCLPTLFTIVSSLATARRIRRAERVSVRANRKQIRLESQMNCTVVALAILYGFCTIPENICNIVEVYMAAGVGRRVLDILHLVSQILLFCKSALTPVLLLALCRPFGRAFLDCCCCCCEECGPGRSSSADTGSADTEREGPAELELSPFSTARREPSTSYAAVGTHC